MYIEIKRFFRRLELRLENTCVIIILIMEKLGLGDTDMLYLLLLCDKKNYNNNDTCIKYGEKYFILSVRLS